MILSLQSNAPAAARLNVLSETVDTGYALLSGADFGSPVWDHSFSAPRGTQGARAAQGKLPNRQVTLPIRVAGATKDAMATAMGRTLAATVDDLRRFGGTCRMRSKGQTRYQSFDVLTASVNLPSWDNRLEQRFRGVVVVTLICGPYVLGDPMDVWDDFATDNVNAGDANYTADAGALTNVSVTGGRMTASANLATENRLIYTGNGYTYSDHEATVRFAPASTITSFKAGVVFNRVDASNYLVVYVDDNGANSRLRIDKVVAGITTNLASTNLGARIVNGRWAWCRGRIEGNVVYAEHFIDTDVPNPVLTPTTSTSYTLTTAEAATFGAGIEGKAGIVFTPQTAGAYIEDFQVLPFTYRTPPTGYVLDCYGAVPGDATALCEARVAPTVSTNGVWGMFAWAPRPLAWNQMPNGDFEIAMSQWSVAAVAGVTSAATSISQVTDSTLGVGTRYGETLAQIVTPATANTGATRPLYRRFRKGITYTATAWVRASAGTTAVRCRLGVSGDIASSGAVALSTTWTQHTVQWTPTADVDLAYFAVEVTAATATTFQLDGVVVYQGSSAPAAGRHPEGAGAVPPLATGRAEEYVIAASGFLTRTADATANGGFSIAEASVPAGGRTGAYLAAIDYVDPGLAGPDDYSKDTVTVEVWARLMLSVAFGGGVTAIASALPDNQAGARRYTSEFGSAGRTLVLPSSGNAKWRMTRLGTIDLPASRSSSRWSVRVEVNIAAGTNLQAFAIDDIWVIPVRSRVMGATGKSTTGYPFFCNLATGSWRTIRPDLSSLMESAVGSAPVGGLGGSLLELPTGQVSVFAVTSSMVPDSPDADPSSEAQSFPSIHLAITPRWHWLRDA